jgi:hypothetical protein
MYAVEVGLSLVLAVHVAGSSARICDQDSLTQELEFLTTVFKDSGYSPQQIPILTAYVPYTQTAYG